ncbi:MAG: DUF484 family protein [Rhodocyclaceae bacterium]
MQEQDIIQYLLDHPQFFDDNAELLAELKLSHPSNGSVISLTERQLIALREKLAQVQGKLAELIGFGEENDAILEKLHRLAVAVVAANSVAALTSMLYMHLRDDFDVPHVALRAWGFGPGDGGEEFVSPRDELRTFASGLLRPYCGPVNLPEHSDWFGEMAPHIRSVALIPLVRADHTPGLLALGSEDPQRFYNDMGTLYIERIGELVVTALQRLSA